MAVKMMMTAVMTTGWEGEGGKGAGGREEGPPRLRLQLFLGSPCSQGQGQGERPPGGRNNGSYDKAATAAFLSSPLLSSSSAIAPASGTVPRGVKHDTAGADMGRPVHGPAQYPHDPATAPPPPVKLKQNTHQ